MATRSLKSMSRELCTNCREYTYDVLCTCGDKFDFRCLQAHIQEIGAEIIDVSENTSIILDQVNSLEDGESEKCKDTLKHIENWKNKRIQDINDIANEFVNKVEERLKMFEDLPTLRERFQDLSSELHRPTHENLDEFIEIQRRIKNSLEVVQNSISTTDDDTKLETALLSKINPTLLRMNSSSPSSSINEQLLTTIEIEQRRMSTHRFEPENQDLSRCTLLTNGFASTTDEHKLQDTTMRSNSTDETRTTTELINGTAALESTIETITSHELNNTRELPAFSNEIKAESIPNNAIQSSESNSETVVNSESSDLISITPELTNSVIGCQPANSTETFNSVNSNNKHQNDNTRQYDFEPGLTLAIDRTNPRVIPTSEDKYAGTICCHGNQLLFNEFNKTTDQFSLIFISDINDLTTKQIINWETPDVHCGPGDNEWIQDIVYSSKLLAYLILNRSRLRLLQNDSTHLVEFHSFPERTMKRISVTDTDIYLVVAQSEIGYNGDGIIIMDHDKVEQIHKTFRDIMPNRVNRGAGPLAGEISDLAIISNEQLAISYRLERRHEVGVCMFNVVNNGRDWTCTKHLLLEDCWHRDLSYTPRIDWCAKLNVLILVEHLTGHLIMLDSNGQVKGECYFLNATDSNESALNFTVSTNGWIYARFRSAINIINIKTE